MTAGGGDRAEARGHFGGVAATYATFRPAYPPALYAHLAAVVRRRHRAWDCGAGSGQATLDLATSFEHVVASDLSEAQLACMPRRPNVDRVVCRAEASALAPASVDLIVIAQALHWFDHGAFYAEVERVAAPQGVLAAWSYGPPVLDGPANEALASFANDLLGPYWPPERRFVDEAYANIPFPFPPIQAPRLVLEVEWSRTQLLGYVRSWSATARYVATRGYDPVEQLERTLEPLWPDPDTRRRIQWPLAILIGRVSPM